MRSLALVFLFLFAAFFASAQSSEDHKYWGLKAGLNFPWVAESSSEDLELTLGLAVHVGAFKNIPINDNFAARVELLYTQRGGNKKPEEFFLNVERTYTVRSSYLSLPLIFQAHRGRFFGEIGLEPALQVNVSTNNDNEGINSDEIIDTWTSDVDLNLVFGIGVTDSDFEVNLRFLPGLLNVSNELNVRNSSGELVTERFGTNNAVQLSLGYRIFNRK